MVEGTSARSSGRTNDLKLNFLSMINWFYDTTHDSCVSIFLW